MSKITHDAIDEPQADGEEAVEEATEKKRTSHDLLWKEFMERFLAQFMKLFFPDKAARMDFTTLRFHKQEQVINIPRQKLRITDVIAEVRTLTGEPEVIIIHIDNEARSKKFLPKRMFEYYGLLSLLLQKPVLPIAVLLLRDEVKLGWNTYIRTLWDEKIVEFRYLQVGLRNLESETYLKKKDPIAAALSVLMEHEKEDKALIKLTSLQTVANSGLTMEDKLFLLNLIETYLPVEEISSSDVEEEIMQELVEFEMTWKERIEIKAREEGIEQGIERGLEQGIEQGIEQGEWIGRQKALIHFMELKFGPVPAEIIKRVQAIKDHEIFDILDKQILVVTSLENMSIPRLEENQQT